MTALRPHLLARLEDIFDLETSGGHLIRVEESRDNGNYLIRAELPGMESGDIKVSVDHGVLTIEAERSEEKKDKYRTEFRYGSLRRSATLPSGADETKIHASYDKGILEVTVPVGKEKAAGRAIPIETAK